jgi:hypothetical protein
MVNYIANCLEIGRNSSMVAVNNTNNIVAVKKKNKPRFVENTINFVKEFFSLNKLE